MRTFLFLSLLSTACSSPNDQGMDGSAPSDSSMPAMDSSSAAMDSTAMDVLDTGMADSAGCMGFSDDFGTSPLDPCWSVLNKPLIDLSLTNGALHLRAVNGMNGVWYQGSTKSLVWKSLAANRFVITTTARPRKRTDGNMPPSLALHVGGLLVRNPASNGGASENYLFIMVGSDEQAQPGVEVKSTTNGASLFSEPPWSDPLGAELRICRIDANFYLYKRVIGMQTWTMQNHNGQAMPISRPDMPMTVQAGLALNFSGPTNDLDVAFDAITLGPTPNQIGDCTN
jgi:hypothetical protein